MSNLDISKAVWGGISLSTLEYTLSQRKSLANSATNGAVLTLADLLVQSLRTGDLSSVRQFLYRDHDTLTTAMVYTLLVELKSMFWDGSMSDYQAFFPSLVANLFFSAGALAVGDSLNSMLGMNDLINNIVPSSGGGYPPKGGSSSSNSRVVM